MIILMIWHVKMNGKSIKVLEFYGFRPVKKHPYSISLFKNKKHSHYCWGNEFLLILAPLLWLSVCVWVQLWTRSKLLKWHHHRQSHWVNFFSAEWGEHELSCGEKIYPHNSKLMRRHLEIEQKLLYLYPAISVLCS